MTTSQISAAGAYAQADRLAVTIPVRAIDPTRQRFQVEDQATAQEAPDKAGANAEATDREVSSSTEGKTGTQGKSASGGGGFGLLGAVTSFLARMFGQSDASQTTAATSVSSGVQAYTRAAGATLTDNNGTEVLSPSFPRLSSGRAVDLTV